MTPVLWLIANAMFEIDPVAKRHTHFFPCEISLKFKQGSKEKSCIFKKRLEDGDRRKKSEVETPVGFS